MPSRRAASNRGSDLLFEHDLFRKPASTFRDHAQGRGAGAGAGGRTVLLWLDIRGGAAGGARRESGSVTADACGNGWPSKIVIWQKRRAASRVAHICVAASELAIGPTTNRKSTPRDLFSRTATIGCSWAGGPTAARHRRRGHRLGQQRADRRAGPGCPAGPVRREPSASRRLE